MRLTPPQIKTIRDLVHAQYGTSARVHVFGSRTNDDATGGDIDLLVDVPAKVPLQQELALSARLEQELGTSVDVLTTWPGQRERPIVEIARITGIRL